MGPVVVQVPVGEHAHPLPVDGVEAVGLGAAGVAYGRGRREEVQAHGPAELVVILTDAHSRSWVVFS